MVDESLGYELPTLQPVEAKSEPDSGGDGCPAEIDSHLTRLLNLWNRLNSITDRASDAKSRSHGRSEDFELLAIAALREAECADLIEQSMEAQLTTLCGELKQKDEALQARETALVRLEETSNAKLAELETRIHNQENQLRDWEIERQQLMSERDHLAGCLNNAKLAANRPEVEAHLYPLSLDMAKREESVAAKESNLQQAEGDHKTEIENLQLRLQDAEAKLENQEKTLKEKEAGIHAAVLREKEIGKLIERLSSECEKLSEELCEKELIISRLEDTTRHYFFNGAKAWGKIPRVMQVGRLLFGQ
jgi:chromosome segregation ATPase